MRNIFSSSSATAISAPTAAIDPCAPVFNRTARAGSWLRRRLGVRHSRQRNITVFAWTPAARGYDTGFEAAACTSPTVLSSRRMTVANSSACC